jgi:hypothetical protein
MTMEVRIRRASEGTSKHLGEVAFDALDEVIPTIKRWGIADVDMPLDLTGQFWVDDTSDSMDVGSAYFEVVINDEPE